MHAVPIVRLSILGVRIENRRQLFAVRITPLRTMPVPACLQHPLSTRLCGRVPQPQPFLSPVKCQRQSTQSLRPQNCSRCRASTEARTDEQSEVQIEGIDQNFCDDFVCTSSPAVERNLRALARDVVRTSTWTADLFADEVRYKVSAASIQSAIFWFTSFSTAVLQTCRTSSGPQRALLNTKGRRILLEQWKIPKWYNFKSSMFLNFMAAFAYMPSANVTCFGAVQLVTKLRMLSRDVGAVSYRMRGSIATVPVDIEFEDVFELNLLTGRVLKHM